MSSSRPARTFSQQPRRRSHHLLQQPSDGEADRAGGRYRLRIRLKRVDLVNSDAGCGNINLFI